MQGFTPIDIRNIVLAAVSDKLGRYFLPRVNNNSPIVTAISVLPDKEHGMNYPPPDTTISGIECIIHKPRPEADIRLGNDSYRKKKWEIYFNQWDNNGDLNLVVETFINYLQDNKIRFTSPVFPTYNLDAGIVPYCRIAILETYLRTTETSVSDLKALIPLFETISNNIYNYPVTYTYQNNLIKTASYLTPDGNVLKTYNYVNGLVTTITISGTFNNGTPVTKNIEYFYNTFNNVTSIYYTYSQPTISDDTYIIIKNLIYSNNILTGVNYDNNN